MMLRRNVISPTAAACLLVGAVCRAAAGEPELLLEAQSAEALASDAADGDLQPGWDFGMKTLGGRQFWGDVQFFHGWKIQQNVLTGHYRLLDKDDFRRASGSLEECRTKLAEIRAEQNVPPMRGKAVIVVHGIIRSSKSFNWMRAELEKAGYQVFGFDYPSTRVEIPQSAEYLSRCIESLDGIEEINFVVHSMGGLLVRAYLAEHRDPRIRRMVMLGVPNLGAQLADRLQNVWLFQTIFGPAGQQLVTNPQGLIAGLPTPDFEFGVLAGSSGTELGFNLMIPGDDDGVVTVDSTRLPGAADFICVKGLHSFLMYQPDCIDYTIRFLNTGRFREEGEPAPIPFLGAPEFVAPVDGESLPLKSAEK